ncbi:MAG: Ig-like domain-containing protein, partial [Gammaproteobacteria bacterium]|nr:Ig-like domain-containing protein [Gammaproteobacteria bacterium]
DCDGGSGNQLPQVSITAPADGAQFNEGDDVTINADASDPDGSVLHVEFFVGSTSLGADNAEPYSTTWNNASTGSHQLMAVAHDNEGDSSADSVNIAVVGPSGCSLAGWDPTVTYQKTDEVQHNGIHWRAKRTSQGVEPGTSPSRWTNLGPCSQ